MEYSKEDLMEAKKQPSTKKTFLFALGDCSFPRSAFALSTLGDSPRREVSFAFSRSTGFPFATKNESAIKKPTRYTLYYISQFKLALSEIDTYSENVTAHCAG